MELLTQIYGEGQNLSAVQMSCRGITVFILAFVLIRISGRRSFGVRTPLDNIIAILLGAVLSRAVVGASPFVPVLACCFAVVLMHRLFGWLIANSKRFGKIMEGDKILLYSNGRFISDNMKKALVCMEDTKQGVRKALLSDDLSQIDKIYMERNGEISTIKKKD